VSGIVGLANVDGGSVDAALLARLTAALAFRGPDGTGQWVGGATRNVGFGHTLLATADDTPREHQPHTRDGRAWIVADARIDGRRELLADLGVQPSDAELDSDADLILRAYLAWGDACVEHLVGDFAFAIWDDGRRRLFAARDHFGVKAFFYAIAGRTCVFSNTLDTVRLAPFVSDELDDLSIADFLLFKRCLNPEATAWSSIRRLPAAHTLSWSVDGLQIRRYWSLSDSRELRYRKDDEYIEHFRELFGHAVRDRIRTPRVAVSLSGGLDSPFVAATAKAIQQARGLDDGVVAHTIVYDHLIRDEERTYTSIVADSLDIPVRFLPADDDGPFDQWDEPGQWLPEPTDPSYLHLYRRFWARLASDSRVVLTGNDADTVLNELVHERFFSLLAAGRVKTLAQEAAQYVTRFRQRPPIGLGSLRRKLTRSDELPLPVWLPPTLVARLQLRERWRSYWQARAALAGLRPRVNKVVPLWSVVFEGLDQAITRQPLEYRHPFADRRLIDFLLAIPVVPWSTRKTLLRYAATGLLPERILTRPKSPLRENPDVVHLRSDRYRWIDTFEPIPELANYVNRAAVPAVTGDAARDLAYLNLRPIALDWWLRGLRGTRL